MHLALILLRRNGHRRPLRLRLPVGGAGGRRRSSLEVDTHAWIEALLPGTRTDAASRSGSASTRRTAALAGETHVKIGHGRHYPDVPPVKGVYRGVATAELDARVTMTRLDPQASARA